MRSIMFRRSRPCAPDGPVTALVRRESVDVVADPDGPGRVLAASFLGALARITVVLPDDTLVVAQVASARPAALPPGTAARVALRPVPVVVSADAGAPSG